MRKTIPAVSIIIPMYNAEKYIGDCLDSILVQTFDDYEVILVDDCSTDKSCDIVESYLPKFNGKLQLIRSKVNSNTPGMPRNIGLGFARGEYIIFVDNDDAITETALEEIYPIAKKFDADVVYCEKYYPIEEGEIFTTNKAFLSEDVRASFKYNLVSEPTLVSDNIVDRLQDILQNKFAYAPWNYLIRRELIAMNGLRFPNIRYGDDNFWNLYIICLSKNLVRIPNVMYVHRNRSSSLGTSQSVEINVHRYTDHVFQGVSIINEFAKKFPFLKEHSEYRYALVNLIAGNQAGNVLSLYAKIPAWQMEPLIIRELDKINDKTALTSFLFSRMNIFNVQLIQAQQIIAQQQNQINDLQRQLANVK